MIDLLKNYKELKNAPGYAGSIRYYLAKKKLDVDIVLVRRCSWSGYRPTSQLSSPSSKRPRLGNSSRLSTRCIDM